MIPEKKEIKETNEFLHTLLLSIFGGLKKLIGERAKARETEPQSMAEEGERAYEKDCEKFLGVIAFKIQEPENKKALDKAIQLLDSGKLPKDAAKAEAGTVRCLYEDIIADDKYKPSERINAVFNQISQLNSFLRASSDEKLKVNVIAFKYLTGIDPVASAPVSESGVPFECSMVWNNIPGHPEKIIAIYTDPIFPIYGRDNKPNMPINVQTRQVMMEVDKVTGEVKVFSAANVKAKMELEGQKFSFDINKSDPVLSGEGRVKTAAFQSDMGGLKYAISIEEAVNYEELSALRVVSHKEFKNLTKNSAPVSLPSHFGAAAGSFKVPTKAVVTGAEKAQDKAPDISAGAQLA